MLKIPLRSSATLPDPTMFFRMKQDIILVTPMAPSKRRIRSSASAYAVSALAISGVACCGASPTLAFQHHPYVSRLNVKVGRPRNKHANDPNAYATVNVIGRRSDVPPLFLSDRSQALDLQDRSSGGASGKKLGTTTSEALPSAPANDFADLQAEELTADAEYRRGLLTIGFITLIFSSMSPALHAALADTGAAHAPPVLLLNAVVSVVALCGLVLGGPLLEASTPLPRSLVLNRQQAGTPTEEREEVNGIDNENVGTSSSSNYEGNPDEQSTSITPTSLSLETQAGLELGLWKTCGTTANLYGLSLTTADHGAFLIQLTTLIVPVVQGIMGVPIPKRIQTAIALALGGVFLFTTDPSAGSCDASAAVDAVDAIDAAVTNTNSNLALGDALCVVAAGFYATYDLRLFKWGKLVKARELITGKILTQAILSALLLVALGYDEAADYLSQATWENSGTIVLLALWAGLAVNAVAPFLQVGGQQAVGPTRAQTLYASQPLWAAILSFVFLGETVGQQGVVGGAAFLSALFLAATAEPPEPLCGVQNCEV